MTVRLLAAALCAVFLFLPTPPIYGQPLIWDGAIGRLQTHGDNQCTFFIVDRRSYEFHWRSYTQPWVYLIASAGHCHGEEMWVQLGPERFRAWPQGYTSMEYGTDLMLATFHSSNNYRVLPLAERLPAEGEWVRTIGFPHGALLDVVTQASIGINPLQRRAIVLDIALSPGISGGPVLSLAGEVLGVVNMGTYKNPSPACAFAVCQTIAPSYAIPIEELKALMAPRLR